MLHTFLHLLTDFVFDVIFLLCYPLVLFSKKKKLIRKYKFEVFVTLEHVMEPFTLNVFFTTIVNFFFVVFGVFLFVVRIVVVNEKVCFVFGTF